jgi:hypothetical protein
LQGNVTVSGASVLNGGATAGALFVTGGSLFQGDITVSGASVFNGGATAGSIFVTGNSVLNSAVTAGTLFVSGASTFSGESSFAIGFTSANAVITSSSIGTLWATTVSSGTLHATTSLYSNTREITPSLGDIWAEKSFNASNNVTSAANVTNLVFDNTIVRSFNAYVSVTIVKSTGSNLYANFELKAVQKAGTWVINSSYVGDFTGVVFSITDQGQVQYTNINHLFYSSSVMKFRAHTTSI